MKRILGLTCLAFVLGILPVHAQFATNASCSTVDVSRLRADWTDFTWTWRGWDDQHVDVKWTNGASTFPVAGHRMAFQIVKDSTLYILKGNDEITLSTDHAILDIRHTNIPPVGVYRGEFLMYDAVNTNVTRSIARGTVRTLESTWADTNLASYPWPEITYGNTTVTNETDPVFVGKPAYSITTADILNWNNPGTVATQNLASMSWSYMTFTNRTVTNGLIGPSGTNGLGIGLALQTALVATGKVVYVDATNAAIQGAKVLTNDTDLVRAASTSSFARADGAQTALYVSGTDGYFQNLNTNVSRLNIGFGNGVYGALWNFGPYIYAYSVNYTAGIWDGSIEIGTGNKTGSRIALNTYDTLGLLTLSNSTVTIPAGGNFKIGETNIVSLSTNAAQQSAMFVAPAQATNIVENLLPDGRVSYFLHTNATVEAGFHRADQTNGVTATTLVIVPTNGASTFRFLTPLNEVRYTLEANDIQDMHIHAAKANPGSAQIFFKLYHYSNTTATLVFDSEPSPAFTGGTVTPITTHGIGIQEFSKDTNEQWRIDIIATNVTGAGAITFYFDGTYDSHVSLGTELAAILEPYAKTADVTVDINAATNNSLAAMKALDTISTNTLGIDVTNRAIQGAKLLTNDLAGIGWSYLTFTNRTVTNGLAGPSITNGFAPLTVVTIVSNLFTAPTWTPYSIAFHASNNIVLANGSWQFYDVPSNTMIVLPAADSNLAHSLRLDIISNGKTVTIATNSPNGIVDIGTAYVTNGVVGTIIFDKPMRSIPWKAYTLP